MKTLLEQAEEARANGNRDLYLKLKEKAANERHQALLTAHNARVAEVKKQFPIGQYIPELGAHVEAVTDGHGTKSGWISIKLAGREKMYTLQELRHAIYKAKELKRVSARFSALKFPKTVKGRVFIGQYGEAVDDLLAFMGLDRLWGLQEWEENNIDSWSERYQYAFEQAQADGFTDEQAEEKGREAEEEAQTDAYNEYKDKLITSINYVLNYGALELIEGKDHKFYIQPIVDWRTAANKTAEVITGYGMFEFRNGKELKDGLPADTYAEAVIVHLHWLKKGPEVYGNRGYDYLMR